MNECNPRFLGVAVMHWARTTAAELRDSRSGRRQGSSSDFRGVCERVGCGFCWSRGRPNEIIKEVLCRSYRINKAVMSAMQSYSDQAGKK